MLEKINKVLADIKILLDEARNLPKEISDEVEQALSMAKKFMIDSGSNIEKYYQDKEALDAMKKDIQDQLDKNRLFNGIKEETRNNIIENIINKPEQVVVNEDDFIQFLLAELRKLNGIDLALSAYGKQNIIEIGENLLGSKATEKMKYDTGLKALVEIIETPIGRQEAIAYGETKIMETPSLRSKYLAKYYGV